MTFVVCCVLCRACCCFVGDRCCLLCVACCMWFARLFVVCCCGLRRCVLFVVCSRLIDSCLIMFVAVVSLLVLYVFIVSRSYVFVDCCLLFGV